ncbi:glycosyl hydrolase 53 family protein [Cellulosimicrobium sp. PMB13]|uniref:glycoside hydrolase family 53 protein n=1 Tax=Cellulosimicrobium sp. PMB13 TaxID=3120158 RepID=UPI003F4BAFAC
MTHPTPRTRPTVHGADVSMTEEVETLGGVYRDDDGRERDLFELLAESGVDTVRLRTWVDPYDDAGAPYRGGTNDLPTTARLARRAHEHGLDVLLDLHYSDFWTDPKKQAVPKAWRGLDLAALETRVADHTTQVLGALAQVGVDPTLVQVGNEITNGMLWPVGRTPRFDDVHRRFERTTPVTDAAAYDRLAALLRAGSAAVRSTSDAEVVLHLDFGGANELYRGWLDEITARAVDFDVVGLSYYPFWHGTLDELEANVDDVATRYGKDVLVVETAYGHTVDAPAGHHPIFGPELAAKGGYPASPAGQTAFLADLHAVLTGVPDGRGRGVVYWEPAWLPVDGTTWASPAGMAYGDDVAPGGNPWANLALFGFDGRVLPSMRALGETGPSVSAVATPSASEAG